MRYHMYANSETDSLNRTLRCMREEPLECVRAGSRECVWLVRVSPARLLLIAGTCIPRQARKIRAVCARPVRGCA